MRTEEISILVVSYNSSSTIRETLASLINQTVKGYEIVVADDHSTDDTVLAAENTFKEYGFENYSIVINPVNTGTPGNLNNGLKHVKGTYVKLMAADDLLTENAIERFANLYEESVIHVSNLGFTGADEKAAEEVEKYIKTNLDFYEKSNSEQYKILLKNNVVSSPALGLIPIEVFKEVGYYDTNYRLLDDYPMILKLSKYGCRFSFVEDKLTIYRINPHSIMKSRRRELDECSYKFFADIRQPEMLKKFMFVTALKQTLHFKKLLQ